MNFIRNLLNPFSNPALLKPGQLTHYPIIIAQYERDDYSIKNPEQLHWAIIVLEDVKEQKGPCWQAINRNYRDGRVEWNLSNSIVRLASTSKCLGGVCICHVKAENVKDLEQLVLTNTPTVKFDGWNCRDWVIEVIGMLKDKEWVIELEDVKKQEDLFPHMIKAVSRDGRDSMLGWLLNYYFELRSRYERIMEKGSFSLSRIRWFPFGLLLKLGRSDVGLEADTLRYIRQHTSIPVPRVIASAVYGKYAYTLMQRIEGERLDIVWPYLDAQQRSHVASQLLDFVTQLKRLRPPPQVRPGSICSLYGHAIRDSRISSDLTFGPYSSENEFNNRLIEAADVFVDRGISEPIRSRMRDNHRIVFTHGDFTPRNILVHGDIVVAVIDWEESGWLPEHWELVKARWSSGMDKDSGWNEALWTILGREQEEDWLLDRELSDYMVGAF
ncbi:hypothetical protein H0H92_002413 [Tricholoma furcatifolium]|nr:hypothetical protein H0H92_002413 [Tricholoma furcatifolium]